MARRNRKQRKHKSKPEGESRRAGEMRASEALRRKLAAEGVNLAGPLPGAPKASDALVKVVEPLLEGVAADTGMNKKRMEDILRLGILAWNAHSLGYTSMSAFLEEHGRDKLDLDDEDEFMMSIILEPLLHRRRKLFGHDRRLLADFVVLPPLSPSGEFRISVAWANPKHVAATT